MAASANDKFMKVGYSTATTLSSPGYTVGNTSINVGSTSNMPTDTGIYVMIDETDANGERESGTYNVFRGVVSSATQISSLVYEGGDANRNFSAGATTRVYITVSKFQMNRLIDGLLAEHNQDGTHGAVTATSVVSSGAVTGTTLTGTSLVNTGDAQLRSTSLETIRSETEFDYVASGCVWTADAAGSTLLASMTSGVVYIGGRRVTVNAVSNRAFTASRDTYIDVGTDGTVDYSEVTNNNASPALAASHIRLGIIVTGGSSIANAAAINQGQEDKVLPIASSIPYTVTDSLGNLICTRDPQRKVLGYRQILSAYAGTTNAGSGDDVTGLSVPFISDGLRKVVAKVGGKGIKSTAGAGQTVSVRILESTTELASVTQQITTNGYDLNPTVESKLLTPSAGLHTYKTNLLQSAAGTQTLTGTSTAPAYIKVERA